MSIVPNPRETEANPLEITDDRVAKLIKLLHEFLPADRAQYLGDLLPESSPQTEHKFHIHTPREIKNYLDKFVVDCDHAKRTLAGAAYNHYLMHGLHFPVDETRRILGTYFSIRRGREDQAEALTLGITEVLREHNINRRSNNPIIGALDVAFRAGIESDVIRAKELRGDPAAEKRRRGEAHSERVRRFIAAACEAQKRMQNPAWAEKKNILIMGATGTGKTLLMKKLAEFLSVPFLRLDATQFSSTAYQGESVEDIPKMLLEKAKGNKKSAERGIVFVDEIDKKYSRSDAETKGDVVGADVQHNLLTFLEDYEDQNSGINMRGVMFVLGGAFNKLPEIIAKRMGFGKIGFGNLNTKQIDPSNFYSCAQPADLEQFGMIKELTGRVALTYTEPMTVEKLSRILLEPNNSIFDKHQRLLGVNGVELSISEDGAEQIAAIAHKRGTGARALKEVMETLLADLEFHAPDLRGQQYVNNITLDQLTVEKLWNAANPESRLFAVNKPPIESS